MNPPELEEWDCGIKDATITPQLKDKDRDTDLWQVEDASRSTSLESVQH